MKKWLIAALVVAVLGAGAFVMTQGGFGGQGAQATPTVAPVVTAKETIVADGKVVPVRSAHLSVSVSGVVAKVLVEEGARVTPGQVVLQLETTRSQAALAQADAGLKRARAGVEQVKAGARPQEVAAAQAAVDAAQAQVARLRQGARSDEVAAAEAVLAAAQANLTKAQEGPNQATVTAARADLANAEAALKQAQAAYDKVAWEPDIQARPEALLLEQATNTYTSAKARYDSVLDQPSAATVQAAAAQVQQAQATLDRLQAGAQSADLAAAQAEVRRAQAQLELIEAGARPEAVAAAEADVATAQAAVEQAKVALLDAEVRAPFAGTVAQVDAVVGELVAPGNPVVQVADFSGWQIETTDLSELDVVRIREGDRAIITFDAIPDLELAGKVSRIKSVGATWQGDITYTVVVAPDQPDQRLRWNMTASVSIEPAE